MAQNSKNSAGSDPQWALHPLAAALHIFCDYLVIRLPITDHRVLVGGSNFSADGVAYAPDDQLQIDFPALQALTDIRVCGETFFGADRRPTGTSDLYSPYASLPTSHGGIAYKIFQAHPQTGVPAHIEIKASPAGLADFQNFISDVTSIAISAKILLGLFIAAAPKLAELVDFRLATVTRFDATGNFSLDTPAQVQLLIDRHRHIKKRHFGAADPEVADEAALAHYKTTIIFSPKSAFFRAELYAKGAETDKKIADLRRVLRRTPNDPSAKKRLECLTRPEFRAAVDRAARYEARGLRRGIELLCEKLGHRWSGGLWDLIEIETALAAEGKNLLACLWSHVWRPVLEALEGTDMDLLDTEKNREKIFATLTITKSDGRKSDARAWHGWRLYEEILSVGYETAKSRIKKSAWHRVINDLIECGFSLAALQACTGDAASRQSAGVVIQLRTHLAATAVTSLPSWYQGADHEKWLSDEILATVGRRVVGSDCVASAFPEDFPRVDHDLVVTSSAIDASAAAFSEWLRRDPSDVDFTRKISGHVRHIRSGNRAEKSIFGVKNRSDWSPK